MLQRIGDADLFGSWPILGASRAMEQISSRLCPLPELFTFLPRSMCASDFFLRPSRSSRRNSTIVFSSPMAKESLTSYANNRFTACPEVGPRKEHRGVTLISDLLLFSRGSGRIFEETN